MLKLVASLVQQHSSFDSKALHASHTQSIHRTTAEPRATHQSERHPRRHLGGKPHMYAQIYASVRQTMHHAAHRQLKTGAQRPSIFQ